MMLDDRLGNIGRGGARPKLSKDIAVFSGQALEEAFWRGEGEGRHAALS